MSSQAADTHEREQSFYTAQRGLMSWLITLDHKRLGVMYLAATIVIFLTVLTVIGTLLSDLLLAWLDPRIRFEAQAGA